MLFLLIFVHLFEVLPQFAHSKGEPVRANVSEGALVFRPMWGHEIINDSTYYKLPEAKDSLQFELISFYIGHIVFLKNGDTLATDPIHYHLVALDDTLSQKISIAPWPQDADQISFALGVDSLTNVSGAMGGDLDPTKGMYWAWQSGYINVKIEGNSPQCPTRKNRFQFHLGGYMAPFQTFLPIKLPLKTLPPQLVVNMDLARFFSPLDLAVQNSFMIPGPEAKQLSLEFSKVFSVF